MRKRFREFRPSLPHTTEDAPSLQQGLTRSCSSILNDGPQHERTPSSAADVETRSSSSATRRVFHKLAGKRTSLTDSKESASGPPMAPSGSTSSSNQSTSPISPPSKTAHDVDESIPMSKTKSNHSHFSRETNHRTHDIVTNVMDVRKTLQQTMETSAGLPLTHRLPSQEGQVLTISQSLIHLPVHEADPHGVQPTDKMVALAESVPFIEQTDQSVPNSNESNIQAPILIVSPDIPSSHSNLMLYLQQQSMYNNLLEMASLQVPFPLTWEQFQTVSFLSAIPISSQETNESVSVTHGFKKRKYTLLGALETPTMLPSQIEKESLASPEPLPIVTVDLESKRISTQVQDVIDQTTKASLARSQTLLSPLSDVSNKATPFSVVSGAKLAQNQRSVTRQNSLQSSWISNSENKDEGALSILFASESGTLLSVFSILLPMETKTTAKRGKVKQSKSFAMGQFEKMGANLTNISENIKRRKAQSFSQHLSPSEFSSTQPQEGVYNPYFVDDPELKTGKNRTVITLPCFMGSIIPYAKPVDLKKELNQVFRSTHPQVDTSLTLSQIRNLKTKMLQVGRIQDMELSSVAIAFVYFEKLVLKGWVGKQTRRLIAGVCLLLAAKVNDPKERKYSQLLETIEKVMDVSPREIYEHEFSVYASLEFTLFLPAWEVMPHLERILSLEGKTCEEYVGYQTFFNKNH